MPPLITRISPANITTDFRGSIVLSGEYFGKEGAKTQLFLGGVPLCISCLKADRIEATLNAGKLPEPGTNDVWFQNPQGSCVATQAITVAKVSPVLKTAGPSTVFQDYQGKFVFAGDFLGTRKDEVTVSIGGVVLATKSATGTSVEAEQGDHQPLKAGTNDVVLVNRQGSFLLPQAITVLRALPTLKSIAPATVSADYQGTFVLVGEHLGAAAPAIELGGTPLSASADGENTFAAKVVAGAHLKPGTNDLIFVAPTGSAALTQAVVVTAASPIIRSVGPTNVNGDYRGEIILTGENLGYDTAQITAALGGAALIPTSANGTTIAMKAKTNFGVGTNDLVFRNQAGSFVFPKAVTVAKAGAGTHGADPVAIKNRPKLDIASVVPNHGFFSGPTTFLVTGTNFNPETVTDIVQSVIVGGIIASNVQVLSNEILQFEMPPLGTNSTNTLFADRAHAADVVIRSASQFAVMPKAIFFDLKSPTPASAPVAQPATAADQWIDKQAGVLKAFQAVQTNSTPLLTGPLRLEIGEPASRTNGISAQATTVIIQNSQNTNSVH